MGIELGRGRRALAAAQLVPDAVDDGLPQIGLERAFARRLEAAHLLEGTQQRLLDEVIGVGHVPREARQATFRPAAEPRKVTPEQGVERARVAGADTLQEREGRFGIRHGPKRAVVWRPILHDG